MAIKIPSDQDNSNVIRIEGEPQGVKVAKEQLLEMAKRMVCWFQVLQVVNALIPCDLWETEVNTLERFLNLNVSAPILMGNQEILVISS